MKINIKNIIKNIFLIITGENSKRKFLKIINSDPQHRDLNENIYAYRYLCHQLDKVIMNEFDENNIRGESKYKKALDIYNYLQKEELAYSPDIIWGKHVIDMYERWKKNEDIGVTKILSRNLSDDFISVVNRRRSIRNWDYTKISNKTINKIIELGLMAPSSCNRQSFKINVIENTNSDYNNSKVTNDQLISKAPYVIYISLDRRLYSEKFAPAIDAGIISQNILLSLEYFGYGGCPIYHCEMYDQKELKKILKIEKNYYIYLAIPFGKYSIIPETPARVPVERITDMTSINTDLIKIIM